MNQNLLIVAIIALMVWPFALAVMVFGPGQQAIDVGVMGAIAQMIIAGVVMSIRGHSDG